MNIEDKILPGYLYSIDRLYVTGYMGAIDSIKSALEKGLPLEYTEATIYVLFKGNSDEPDDTIRINTRFIPLNRLIQVDNGK